MSDEVKFTEVTIRLPVSVEHMLPTSGERATQIALHGMTFEQAKTAFALFRGMRMANVELTTSGPIRPVDSYADCVRFILEQIYKSWDVPTTSLTDSEHRRPRGYHKQ